MNKSSYTLFPGWHVPTALVLIFMIGSVSLDMAVPQANTLRAAGHAALARYYVAVGILVWAVALVVLLPKTRNDSRLVFVRTLGKLPLPIRYFVIAGAASLLFGIGALLEKFAV